MNSSDCNTHSTLFYQRFTLYKYTPKLTWHQHAGQVITEKYKSAKCITFLSHWRSLSKKTFVRRAKVELGSSKPNCSWHYLTTSILLVLNSFIKKIYLWQNRWTIIVFSLVDKRPDHLCVITVCVLYYFLSVSVCVFLHIGCFYCHLANKPVHIW